MESQDYEHYRNLTLMFFFEKLLEKGGKIVFSVAKETLQSQMSVCLSVCL